MSASPEPQRTPEVQRTRATRSRRDLNIDRHGSPVRVTDLYHSLISLGWAGFFGVLLLWYLLVNVLFGLGYYFCGPEGFEGLAAHGGFSYYLECFFFSVQTFATIGYGHVSPRGLGANLLVTFEALLGLLSISVATGLLYGRFSKPTARILFSDVAVVNTHDGTPSLLFRLANERSNMIASAEMRVTLLSLVTTSEGETYRDFHDLVLERSDTPVFALTWTVVHPITAESPLYGKDRKALEDMDAVLLVTVTGVDDTLVQPIHARFSYEPQEILWEKKFVDILCTMPNGRVRIDVDRFHDVADA